MANQLTAGVVKKGNKWEGVIRLGKAVIWRCGHAHNNRHECTGMNPISAFKCSSTVLEVFGDATAVQRQREWRNTAHFSSASMVRQASLTMRLYEWAQSQRRYLTV